MGEAVPIALVSHISTEFYHLFIQIKDVLIGVLLNPLIHASSIPAHLFIFFLGRCAGISRPQLARLLFVW